MFFSLTRRFFRDVFVGFLRKSKFIAGFLVILCVFPKFVFCDFFVFSFRIGVVTYQHPGFFWKLRNLKHLKTHSSGEKSNCFSHCGASIN